MTAIRDYGVKCLQDEAQALLDLIPLMTEDFDKSVNLIFHCKGKLIVTGVGKSGHIGAKIAATMASTGTPSFFVNPLDAFHGDLGMITPNDVVLAISNSGQTDELLRFIPYLTERNVPLIGMSGNPNSLLAQYSNYHLNIAVKKEACPLNLAPTSSTTATLAMGDALACALMEVRQFKPQDFAKYHPGGSLGKRLLMKVKDVMRKENIPIITENLTLEKILFIISEGKLGLAIITQNNKIAGIITDGDIRRKLQELGYRAFRLGAFEIMNKGAITISENEKLAKIEEMIKIKNIHVILVTNENNELTGIIESTKFNII